MLKKLKETFESKKLDKFTFKLRKVNSTHYLKFLEKFKNFKKLIYVTIYIIKYNEKTMLDLVSPSHQKIWSLIW